MLRSRFICPNHSAIGPKSLISAQSAARMTKTAFYLGNVGLFRIQPKRGFASDDLFDEVASVLWLRKMQPGASRKGRWRESQNNLIDALDRNWRRDSGAGQEFISCRCRQACQLKCVGDVFLLTGH